MKKIRYIMLSLLTLSLVACENEIVEDIRDRSPNTDLPVLTNGTVDFSNYVAVGASFTGGMTDGGIFRASQENSFPNIMAKEFAKIGGGTFTQPLMNDNFGGLAFNGTRIDDPRLVFGGAGPVPLESVIGSVTITTDIASNNPVGPFNNLGLRGSPKSFDFVTPGYGNIANYPGTANPYAVRLTGDTPNASIIDLAVNQNPTFFSLTLFAGNDVLAYATSGGDETANTLTDISIFNSSLDTALNALTANGAKGIISNTPNVTSIPFFTTVPYNPLDPNNEDTGPELVDQIPTLNSLYGALNGVYAFLESQGAITDAAERSVVFSTEETNPVVIVDENLTNISSLITQTLLASPQFPAFLAQFGLPAAAAPDVAGLLGLIYGQSRQATSDDLLLLTSISVIGNVNSNFAAFLESQGLSATLANQFATEGVTLPLEDKWVLITEEQQEIATAVDEYNSSLSAQATSRGLAYVDLKTTLETASTIGIQFDEFFMNTDLVFGGFVSLDGVHLTSRGYAYMANLFLKEIDATYGSNFEASGNLAKAGDYPTNFSPLLP